MALKSGATLEASGSRAAMRLSGDLYRNTLTTFLALAEASLPTNIMVPYSYSTTIVEHTPNILQNDIGTDLGLFVYIYRDICILQASERAASQASVTPFWRRHQLQRSAVLSLPSSSQGASPSGIGTSSEVSLSQGAKYCCRGPKGPHQHKDAPNRYSCNPFQERVVCLTSKLCNGWRDSAVPQAWRPPNQNAGSLCSCCVCGPCTCPCEFMALRLYTLTSELMSSKDPAYQIPYYPFLHFLERPEK